MNFRNILENLIEKGEMIGHLEKVPNFMHLTEIDLYKLETNIKFDINKNNIIIKGDDYNY